MKIRIIADTNIFISGIFWEGNFSSQVIGLWRSGKIELVSSLPIVEEIVRNLRDFKIEMDEENVKEWEKIILENAILIESSKKLDIVKEDPDDNKFLEAAIAGNAEYIVTQDKHLLKLKEYQGVKIMKPEEFLRNLE